MSHHYDTDRFDYNTNGDFDGDVSCVRKSDGAKMDIPFSDMKMLVAEYVRANMVSRLEGASDDSVLGVIHGH